MASLRVSHELDFLADDGNWRLRMWVSEADGVSEKVFVHQDIPDAPGQDRGRSRFSHVAQPADLQEYPEDASDGTTTFFRKQSLDLVFKSPELMANAYRGIDADVTDLVMTLNEVGL